MLVDVTGEACCSNTFVMYTLVNKLIKWAVSLAEGYIKPQYLPSNSQLVHNHCFEVLSLFVSLSYFLGFWGILKTPSIRG